MPQWDRSFTVRPLTHLRFFVYMKSVTHHVRKHFNGKSIVHQTGVAYVHRFTSWCLYHVRERHPVRMFPREWSAFWSLVRETCWYSRHAWQNVRKLINYSCIWVSTAREIILLLSTACSWSCCWNHRTTLTYYCQTQVHPTDSSNTLTIMPSSSSIVAISE